ncbi:hypothetical protein PsorP6_008550 [Peronosclerospora sorghi]|uniref:Uncharacterized protein n=1 Tax=Peronosclerospora sorghi TaxID=230839 RepID=A0ACC0W7R8_9STRA|nr:hypothetical protein PsorP6_008550 [Peronosclerospora sorghi]
MQLKSLLVVAGIAIAGVSIYKYAAQRARDRGETEAPGTVEPEENEDVISDCLSQSDDDTEEADEERCYDQLLLGEIRGKNMILATFGLLLMVLVTIVSLIISWDNVDGDVIFSELPMFQPLMWVAIGILAGGLTALQTSQQKRI